MLLHVLSIALPVLSIALPVPSIALPVPSIALPVGMQYDASVTETIQRRSQSSGAANPAAPPIQRRRQSSGAANPAAQPIQRRSQSSGAANPAAPPDGDDDGGGDSGGRRISGQVQPPNPITPRDNISRSGTRPHSDFLESTES